MELLICKINEIDWKNDYQDWERTKLYGEYKKFIRRGFDYTHFDKISLRSDYVTTPRGLKLTQLKIEEILSGKLIIGDEKQIEALDAIEVFKLAWVLSLD